MVLDSRRGIHLYAIMTPALERVTALQYTLGNVDLRHLTLELERVMDTF